MVGKIALERAEKIATAVIEKLSPYCESERIVAAGSVRRKRPWPADIDFVLVPSDPWRLHNEIMLLGQGKAKVSGPKIMRVMWGEIQLDFYLATQETWATLLLIRTGSVQNNIRLCFRAQEMGYHLAASGDGLFNGAGERIAGDTELSIYNALGLPWQRPEERG